MKLLGALLLSVGLISPAVADGYRGYHGHGGYGGGSWVAPLIIGGTIGYMISNQRNYNPPPVVYSPPPAQVYSLPPRQPVYEERWQFDPNCNCYVKTYNQIGWQ